MKMKYPEGYIANSCGTSYKFLDKDDKLIQDINKTNCFIKISSSCNILTSNVATVVVYYQKKYFAYTEPDIKRYIKEISIMGFPCQFKGLNADGCYEIYVSIFSNKKIFYKKKDHLLSTLTMIRYLFESNFVTIPKYYFDICKAVGPKVNKIIAFQIAHTFSYCGGHALMNTSKGHCYAVKKKKEILHSLNTDIKDLLCKQSSNIFSHWEGRPLKTVHQEKNLKQLYMEIKEQKVPKTKVYVVGGAIGYANWLPNHEIVKSVEESNVVLFTGGEDVHPALYREPSGKLTGSNINRDIREIEIFYSAKNLGKKLLGICRGSQFLCAMAGGRLVQHQENPKYEHPIHFSRYGQGSYGDDPITINITSTHHQAAFPFNLPVHSYKVLGWTNDMSKVHLDGTDMEMNPKVECEIVKYNSINALGIQGHPEMISYQNNKANEESLQILKNLFKDFMEGNI